MVVGQYGDLRAVILVVFKGALFAVLGVDGGEIFCSRCERRGVEDAESIFQML